ncbi:MAG: hypothetical protein F6K54_16220 [Okeania sp. SIO3B5]|uniref:hypothetical protein n=1 Tax=Okeania sp. SIO3B5 TaxID=2607811 RepID=UPI0014007A96|nr:hypothetical protein [Okeania sp. SIO3B5]NEO54490.1 hypothetical protein [Okeania sp. SIO3B5]
MAKERISEPISNSFLNSVGSAGIYNTIIDFRTEKNKHDRVANGSEYNVNYVINHISVSYIMPSLAPKPDREYSLANSDLQQMVDDIEYERLYNDATFNEDGKPYASKLVLVKTRSHLNQILGHVLLYNSYKIKNKDTKPPFTREYQDLMRALGTPIMTPELDLRCYLTRFEEGDEVIISASYTGNVNYTFDTGVLTHHNFYPD